MPERALFVNPLPRSYLSIPCLIAVPLHTAVVAVHRFAATVLDNNTPAATASRFVRYRYRRPFISDICRHTGFRICSVTALVDRDCCRYTYNQRDVYFQYGVVNAPPPRAGGHYYGGVTVTTLGAGRAGAISVLADRGYGIRPRLLRHRPTLYDCSYISVLLVYLYRRLDWPHSQHLTFDYSHTRPIPSSRRIPYRMPVLTLD